MVLSSGSSQQSGEEATCTNTTSSPHSAVGSEPCSRTEVAHDVPFCSVLAKERYGAYQVIWVLQTVFGNFM